MKLRLGHPHQNPSERNNWEEGLTVCSVWGGGANHGGGGGGGGGAKPFAFLGGGGDPQSVSYISEHLFSVIKGVRICHVSTEARI